ncbi:MAG: VanZ family protein, partial [Prevotella sp.]|nr:VanZ family protein [Prevotella sp.]
THIAMYAGTFGIMWIEYLRKNDTYNRKKMLWLGIVAPILMGGLIEILQANCTGGRRSGEWLDFFADAIGVIIAAIFGILLVWYHAKARTDS